MYYFLITLVGMKIWNVKSQHVIFWGNNHEFLSKFDGFFIYQIWRFTMWLPWIMSLACITLIKLFANIIIPDIGEGHFFFKLINWQFYSIHLSFLGFSFVMHYTTLISLKSFNKSMAMETWLTVSKNESIRPNEIAPTLCRNCVRKCSVLHLPEWSTWQTSYLTDCRLGIWCDCNWIIN